MTRELKLTAQFCELPIFLLCQLNRASEKEKRKLPMLSDLRDSGNIEQDADTVSFIDRPYMRGDSPDESEATLYVRKNRSGRVGEIKYNFIGNVQYFEEVEDEQNVRIYQD
jgi:replicative DNA helicase